MTTKITISANDGWPVLVTSRLGGQNGSTETSTVNPGATQEFNIHASNELVIRELSGSGVKPADIRDPSDPRPMAPSAPLTPHGVELQDELKSEQEADAKRVQEANDQRARDENQAQLKLEATDKKPEPVKLAGVNQGPLTPLAKPATTITR